MPEWNGAWKQCTGCWIYILKKTIVVLKTKHTAEPEHAQEDGDQPDKERSASKHAISKIMFDCLLDPFFICNIFEN